MNKETELDGFVRKYSHPKGRKLFALIGPSFFYFLVSPLCLGLLLFGSVAILWNMLLGNNIVDLQELIQAIAVVFLAGIISPLFSNGYFKMFTNVIELESGLMVQQVGLGYFWQFVSWKDISEIKPLLLPAPYLDKLWRVKFQLHADGRRTIWEKALRRGEFTVSTGMNDHERLLWAIENHLDGE